MDFYAFKGNMETKVSVLQANVKLVLDLESEAIPVGGNILSLEFFSFRQ